MSPTSLTVPATVRPRLREAAKPTLELLGVEISEHYEDRNHCRDVWARMLATWSLLDVIGWTDEDGDTTLDIGHVQAARAALDVFLPMMQSYAAEAHGDDREREADELRQLREFDGVLRRAIAHVTVPAEVAAHLRCALYAELARAGCDLDAACSTKQLGDVATPVGKLRGVFALLDHIGWSKTPDAADLAIDGAHLGLVVAALERDQDGWEWTAEQPKLEDLPGRERAKAIAEMIERFLGGLR
jgi:hypothetical protein